MNDPSLLAHHFGCVDVGGTACGWNKVVLFQHHNGLLATALPLQALTAFCCSSVLEALYVCLYNSLTSFMVEKVCVFAVQKS